MKKRPTPLQRVFDGLRLLGMFCVWLPAAPIILLIGLAREWIKER